MFTLHHNPKFFTRICLILVASGTFSSYAQSPTQNCLGAIPICQNVHTQINSYSGFGTIAELNGSNQGCLTTGENNSVWYILNTATPGMLAFTISATGGSADYDFAVWDLTDKSCAAIAAGMPPIRCNYASLPNSSPGGLTGLSLSALNPSLGAAGPSFSSAIAVSSGQTFVIMINNSSGSTAGYTIDFSSSTCQILDNVAPTIKNDTIPASCSGPTSMKILMTENVVCSSFASNGSDFQLSPAVATITGAGSASCSAGGTYTNLFDINFSAPLSPGNYTLSIVTGTDGNTLIDNCGNATPPGSSIAFYVSPGIHASVNTQFGCPGTPSGVITVSGNGGVLPYTYKINAGAYTSNNMFSGLYAGTYTISVKDINGCINDTVVNLVQGPMIQIVSASVANLICYGVNTGSVTVNATGGVPPLSYAVGTSAYGSSNTISNLPPGNHVVHVKDANNCVKDTVLFISSPGQVSINSLTVNHTTCGNINGSIYISAYGGTAPLQYAINSSPFQSVGAFTGLAPGVYQVHIKDANNCVKDTTVILQAISLVNITNLVVSQPDCAGNTGSITVNGNAGTLPYSYSLNGAPYTTANTFSSLVSGTYSFTIKDANGCTDTSSATLIDPSNLFFTNVTVEQPTCVQQGSITVHGTGGAPPYQFALNSGSYSSVFTFTSLVSGSFVVHLQDANGCLHDTTIVLPNIVAPFITSLSSVSPTCSYPYAGLITADVTGGVSPLMYSLNGAAPVSSPVFSSLPAGSYTVAVSDANSCTHSATVVLIPSNSLIFSSFSKTNVACGGSPLGSVSATISNGNPPYQYSLNGSPFQGSGTYTSLSAGNYTITAEDASGCTRTSVFTVYTSSVLNVSTLSTSPSLCNTPSDGSININGTVSAPPLTYSLNGAPPQTSGSFTSLSPGIYTITLNDGNGCYKDTQVNVIGPPPMYFSDVIIVYPPCDGGIGSISMQGTGGTPPYTYTLNTNTPDSTANWTSLPAGTYSIHLVDANGCTRDTTVYLMQPPQLSISGFSVLNASCSGAASGSISISATNGTPPYSYALNSGPFSMVSSFSGLGPGFYVVHITDGNNCTKDTSVTLSANGNFVINPINLVKPSCNGQQDGSITFNASGGTPPYLFAFNNDPFGTTNTFSGLATGTYTLHAKDNAGCFHDSVITLSEPDPMIFLPFQFVSPSCLDGNNGSLVVGAIGGTPIFEVNINGGAFTTYPTFSNLSIGYYTIGLKDTKGCYEDSVVYLPGPAPLHFVNPTIIGPGCLGAIGLITVNGNGGTSPYQYAIGSGPFTSANSFTNLPTGVYTIHLADANLCAYDTVISLTTNQVISLNSVTAPDVICPNTTDGYLYSSAFSANPPLQYSCNGGVPQASGNFNNLGSGTYTLHIQDLAGCFIDSVITIQSAPPVLINNMAITPAACHTSADGSVLVNAIGGLGILSYALNTGVYSPDSVFGGLPAGSYALHVKDSIGCQRDSTVQVSSPPAIYFSSINLVQPYCSNATNGKITIAVAGGQPPYQYAINTSLYTTSNLFQNLYQGVYTILVKDYNGCIYDTIVNLVAANYMDFNNVLITPVSCKYGNDGSISLGVTGGFSPYAFTINSVSAGSSGFFGNLGTGSYTVNVVDVTGCAADSVIFVSEPLLPVQALLLGTTPSSCRGDSLGNIACGGAGGTPPYSYSLNGLLYQTSQVFYGMAAGSYIITVKDSHGCIGDTSAVVLEPDTSVQLFLVGIKDVSCIGVNDGSITVTSQFGSKPLHYYLNGAGFGIDTFYSMLAPGNYVVEVKDSLNCKSTGKFTIVPSDRRPYIIMDSIQGIACAGDKNGYMDWHTINTFPPYYYTFDSIYLDTVSHIHGLPNGTYWIRVVDSIGCKADTTISLIENNPIELDIQATPALCSGLGDDGKAKAIVIGGQKPFVYSWSGAVGDSSGMADHLLYGPHVAYVEDALGCIDTAHFDIEYDPCCLVSLPSAFSPNADGKNDIFKAIQFGYINLISFEVYNRWGNRVFSSNTESKGWDGKFLGADCELGTYFYLLRYRCHLKNETITLKGDVLLLR